ncbi:MAG: FGGY-family carbohydrate kinase [Pseudomonadota bacterium]
MKDLIIGIDAGTSIIKAVAFDLEGQQIALASTPNRYETLAGAAIQQDMTENWQDTAKTLRDLADKIPNLANRTAAVAVTGQGDGTWLIDKDGQPVSPAWLWLDGRAATWVETFRQDEKDTRRFSINGCGLAACQQAPQLNWMAQHTPEVIERAVTAMHCKDWLYLKLTGERVTDPSEGCFTFGDFRTRRYSDEVIDLLKLTAHRHLLPEMLDGSQHHHPLTAQAARQTGLLAGTPVCLGFVDIVCTVLGAGLYQKGVARGCTVVGSTGAHTRLASSPDEVTLNDARTGYVMAMPIDGVFAQMQTNLAGTINIDWLLDLLVDVAESFGVRWSRQMLLAQMDDWIDRAAPGQIIYQPYILEAGERGPFLSRYARAGFVGLSSSHQFADLARSVIEGLALACRDCYRIMGVMPAEVCLSGGAAQSSRLREIFGGILGVPIRITGRDQAGAAGAAMMACLALGHDRDMQSCADRWANPLLSPAELPRDDLVHVYDGMYESYLAAREGLAPIWKSMTRPKQKIENITKNTIENTRTRP